MGWDSNMNWTKKSEVVQSLISRYQASFEVLAYKSTTSGLWTVVKNKETGLKGIFFDLIKRKGAKEKTRFWVKSMDESMEPYYYDCPKAFLDMVPPLASESFMYSLNWRGVWKAVNL